MNDKYIVEALQMQPLTEEEKSKRHILGRLYGPIATCKESTRNGRHYNKELWEKALSDDITNEKIKFKSMFLELGHPLDDREETIMANACGCIPELPKIVGDDLVAYVDILDTPNGRILKTLCDYGFVPGISSRATGELIGEEVDPDSFQLETWDIVQLPAVEKARLKMVESVNHNSLKQALTESLKSASEEDRKIMKESLNNLGLNPEEKDQDSKIDPNAEKHEDIDTLKESKNEQEKANNVGLTEVIKTLQEALKAKSDLESEIKSLQEKLAVSNSKVNDLNEELNRYKSTTIRLSSLASQRKELATKVSSLEEELKVQKSKFAELRSSSEAVDENSKTLKESLDNKESAIVKLNESLKESESKNNSLKEELEKTKTEFTSKISKLTEDLNKAINESKGWQKTANETVGNYIKTRALMLGVDENEIRNKLPESYTLKDIDKACDDLQTYKLNIGKLPFSTNRNIRVKVNESKNDPLRKQVVNDDDEVSEGLLRISGLKH